MWNIVKAQNYQLKRDNLVIYVFIFAVVLLIVLSLMDVTDLGAMTGSDYVASMGNGPFVVFLLLTLILTPRICGWDFADKTMNYEVLAGHNRKQVYWGRVLSSILWCLTANIILIFLPILIFTLAGGWGVSMNPGGALLRCFLVLFPLFRLICELVLLTFILKTWHLSLAIGFVFFYVVEFIALVLEEMQDINITVQLISSNVLKLLDFSQYSVEYIGGEDVTVYHTALDAAMVSGSVIVSLVVGVVCLMLGYWMFKRSDLK